MATKTEIVLVTGSSGFLGQHIIKLLQEFDNEVEEIRLFDIRPYKNNLGHLKNKPMKEIVGDIRDINIIEAALVGVTCVIHCASAIDVSSCPNEDFLQEVNVRGTQNIVRACIKKNVPKLVFTSSVVVCMEDENNLNDNYSSITDPKTFMMGPYAETKYQAEKIVLNANGSKLNDGKSLLRTISLRVAPMYGEQDDTLITRVLNMAEESIGIVWRIHSPKKRFQMMYVGNAAWAHIKAKQTLDKDEKISGEAYFITDDTPITNFYDNIRPFVEKRRLKLSSFEIPYWLALGYLLLISFIMRIISIVCKPPWKVENPCAVKYYGCGITFNGTKAILKLGYKPLFTVEKSYAKSLSFYSNPIKNM